ncbi:LPS-assembly protein LptD [Helicobacter equorum]|uniref:LPS-assembly protein LptD n=1 Tax=Helicobacter equorum TaxID=361872 RepID=A0A3D8IN10_9HELI|nr:LPS assembly protein LptD [Helicobacter equorum]RDU66602.1 LPS-assembly protein LptD [Helicobacter equorum]
MRFRYIVFICVFAISAYATELQDKKRIFELSANNVTSRGNVVIAKDNAFMLSEDVYMYADTIIYDREKESAVLDGNVRIYRGDSLFVDATRVDMNLKTKHTILQPAYVQNSNGMWFFGKEIQNTDKIYTFKQAVISGCDVQFPIWHIKASSGRYDSQKEYVSAWNSRLYFGSTPLFYLPYFAFPSSTERRSGLLPPEFGNTSREGFVYIQPVYLAPYKQWDFTLSPQIRVARGYGGNAEFRIADEKNNIASFKIGSFHQYDEYIQKYNLLNKEIFGFEVDYSRTGILQPLFKNYKDHLYTSIMYMNDLEYKRLQKLNGTYSTRLHTSRINYFGQSDKHYVGMYFKYFLNLAQESNANTFQTLPNLQYHHSLDTLFSKYLYYAFDVQSKNITRPVGYTYWQNSINVPIGTNISILNNYVNLNGKLDMFASNVSLNKAQDVLDPATRNSVERSMQYAYVNYEVGVNSDVAKAYKYFFHTMHLEGIFSAPTYRYTSDALSTQVYDAYSVLAQTMSSAALETYWNPNEIIGFGSAQPKLDLKFSNYFYNTKGKELFFYRVYQRIYTQNQLLTQNQSLRQEFGLSPFDGLTLTTNIFYSYIAKTFNEASITASFNNFGVQSTLNYFFQINSRAIQSGTYNDARNRSGFVRGSLRYDFGYFQFSGNVGYDTQNNYFKNWSVILSRDIRCFGVALKFAADVRPILTANTSKPIETIANQYIKIEFRFVPLAGVGFTQRLQQQ